MKYPGLQGRPNECDELNTEEARVLQLMPEVLHNLVCHGLKNRVLQDFSIHCSGRCVLGGSVPSGG